MASVALACFFLVTPPSPSPAAPSVPEAEGHLLEDQVGTWDATVENFFAPGGPKVTKAIEVNTLAARGRWLVMDLKNPEQAYESHAILGWDAAKKKLVGTWADSQTPGLQLLEAEFDPTARILSGYFEGSDPRGQSARMRLMIEWKDKDTRVFTLFQPGVPGKEEIALRITHTRRK
jgi:hypothetical protein